MLNDAKLNRIKQTLQLAKQRQKIDKVSSMEQLLYIDHVEHVLMELEHATTQNAAQATRITNYI